MFHERGLAVLPTLRGCCIREIKWQVGMLELELMFFDLVDLVEPG